MKSGLIYSVNLVLYHKLTLRHVVNKLRTFHFLLVWLVTANSEELVLIVYSLRI
jgi:hypothetical protein